VSCFADLFIDKQPSHSIGVCMHDLNAARWAILTPQLDELLTLPPLEQARRLDALAANDPATAGQLRALLDARNAASRVDFLGGAAHSLVATQTEAAGDVLGNWTLVNVIGQGGMGSVWRARRSDGRFEGEAAIKLLRAGFVDNIAQERFRREGAILAKLHHHGIAQLLDAGITERGQPYLVLELIRGERIDRWCEEHSLGLRERIALFAQVLDAVAAAHAQLVIHRDLKPSNILIDESGRVKLLDFGIAQLMGDDAAPGLTREGVQALTPQYAAPEQFSSGPLSVATDVYGLGVVLFELLTGVHPSGLTQGGAMEYMRSASEGGFKLASERCPEQRKTLRGDLDNIFHKALQAAAAQRYSTVASFAQDLTHYLKYEPVAARPDLLTYRAGKFVRRNLAGVALGVLAFVIGVAGVSATALQARKATLQAERAQEQELRAKVAAADSERMRSIAEEQTRAAARETQRATQEARAAEAQHRRADIEAANAVAAAAQARQATALAQRERDHALHELDSSQSANQFVSFLLTESASKPFTASELMRRAADMIERQQQGDAEQRARLLLLVGTQFTELQDLRQAKPLLQKARQAARDAGNAELALSIECISAGAEVLGGETESVLRTLNAAIASLRQLPDAAPSAIAECIGMRAQAYVVRSDGAAALVDADAALKVLGPPRPGQRALAMSLREDRVGALNNLARYGEAVTDMRRLLQETQAAGLGETATAAVRWHNLSILLTNVGQERDAAAAVQTALRLREQLGDKGVDSVPIANLAILQSQLGQHEAARASAQRALEVASSQSGKGPMNWASFRGASVYCEAGQVERCATLLKQAREGFASTLRAGSPVLAQLEIGEGLLALAKGNTVQAIALFNHAENTYRSTSARAGHIRVLLLLASAERQLGHLNSAREYQEQAWTIAQWFAKDFSTCSWVGRARLEDAELRLAEGDRLGAVEIAREALVQLEPTLGSFAKATIRAKALIATHVVN
jgi:hypothetical protein